jgi:hypothetical protein
MSSSASFHHFGPVALGGSLVGLILVDDASDLITAASNNSVTYTIRNGAGTQLAAGTAHRNNDLASKTGAYGINHTILAASGFAVNITYTGLADYKLRSGSARRQGFGFFVV